MADLESQKSYSTKQAIKHWILMVILWIILFFEINFIISVIQRWSRPFSAIKYLLIDSLWGEIIAFALCVIMALYTAGMTIFVVILLLRNQFRNIDYRALNRMHVVVMSGFFIYWLIFLAIFFRP